MKMDARRYSSATRARRLYAFDAGRGTLLWQTVVDDQIAAVITGAPKLHYGRLDVPISVVEDVLTPDPKYPCCRARGALAAVEAETGKILWKVYSVVDPPAEDRSVSAAGTDRWGPSGASICGNSPTIDRVKRAVYVGTGGINNSNPPTDSSDAILAFEMATGKPHEAAAHAGWRCLEHRLRHERAQLPREPRPRSRCWPVHHPAGPCRVDAACSLPAPSRRTSTCSIPTRTAQCSGRDQLGRGGALGGIEWGMPADDTTVYVPLSNLPFGADMMAGKLNPAAGGGLFA